MTKIQEIDQASFGKLNSAMQLAYLVKFARHIEQQWIDKASRMNRLELLKALALSTSYCLPIEKNINEYDFTRLVLDLEKQASSSASDHDFIIESLDHKSGHARQTRDLYLVLDNIRSAFNVGSIFRSADGLGVKKILICGFTPTPDHPKVAQTSLGAEQSVPWQAYANIEQALASLGGIRKIAIETVAGGVSLAETQLPEFCAFIFGNEKHGLTQTTLQQVDTIARLPMLGLKNSLNVAVCTALCCYEYHRQYPAEGAIL